MDILRGWQIPSSGRSEDLSFSTVAIQEEVPTWRMDLPADPELAGLQLQGAEEQLINIQDALEDVPGRIENLVKRVDSQRQDEVSFDAVDWQPAEADLWRWMEAETGAGQVAFGLDDGARQEWQDAREGFQRELERVLRLVAYYAWVETQVQGRWVARSVLRWSGDLDTFWGEAIVPDQAGLHRRSLAVAVSSRNLMLRTILLTTQNAAKLAALLATPGGAVVAIPAVWKFINQVLAEVEGYQSTKNR